MLCGMKNMPLKGVLTAIVLIGIGLVGYLGTGMKSVTALIPAFVGLPLLVASAISFKQERLKLGMHIAATVGLLGFLAPVGKLAGAAAKGEFELKTSTYCMMAMAVVCLVFVLLCVKSFIDVRKARQAGE